MKEMRFPRSWIVFIVLAGLVSTICLCMSDQAQSILFEDHLGKPLEWPHTPRPLEEWELDTESNYSLATSTSKEQPQIREYEFVVSELRAEVGGISRHALAINGKYPGPLIEANEGDTLVIQVKNELADSDTSIHFHGISHNGTNYFDGVAGLTQCGIPPGHTFEYRFKAEPSGTFWYHAHSAMQMVEGLAGPLVIHSGLDHDDHPTYEQDKVIFLSDLYSRDPADLMEVYKEPWIGGTSEPVPAVALAQGKRHPKVHVPRSETVRLRLVNSASYTAFKIQLGSDAKPFEVIEADSTAVKPKIVTSLMIFPAQRYSILLRVDSDSEWLFTTPQLEFYDTFNREVNTLKKSSLKLRVLLQTDESSKMIKPLSIDSFPSQVEEDELRDPDFQELTTMASCPSKASELRYMDLTMARDSEGIMTGAVNNYCGIIDEDQNILANYLAREKPQGHVHNAEMQKQYRHLPASNRVSVSQKSKGVMEFDNWTVLDLIVRNFDDGFHPIHLHGHQMWILGRGSVFDKNYTIDMHPNNATYLPLKRDVIGLPKDEWVKLRVVLDNPGLWSLHCHIPWHGMTGMRVSILSQPEKLRLLPAPESWWNLCSHSHR